MKVQETKIEQMACIDYSTTVCQGKRVRCELCFLRGLMISCDINLLLLFFIYLFIYLFCTTNNKFTFCSKYFNAFKKPDLFELQAKIETQWKVELTDP